ncbi:MAG: FG-GAP-like repeat-containing protein [Niastella sp.]|uniref:FG-GAP-like repeat-containing protein n=1 Tax=Niastella sp. TaxID=1869183 RepID=UPI00389AFF48
MKPIFLLLCIAILSLTRKAYINKNDHAELSASVPFKVTPQLDLPKGIGETDTSQLKQSDWYAGVMKSMAKAEYNIQQRKNTNTFSSPNRKNNLRFNYDENGFTVQPRTTKIPIGKVDETTKPGDIKYKTLPNWKVAFNLDKKQIGEGTWQVKGNQAEYITGNITVQYINDEEGMRQNFIVQEPLSNDDNLQLHFSVKTKLAQQFSKNRLQFADKKSGIVLSYEQLKVWDANGKPLEATFEKSNTDYCIHVNTTKAAYPITIDPLSITPASMLECNQSGSWFGYSVASAGDVNGDGYSDVIVGAHYYDNGAGNRGRAYVYHGSASGISATPAAILLSTKSDAVFAWVVAGAGDVNGDGYSDVIVGAYGYDNSQTDEGAVFVYHGSATGINTTVAAIVESNQAYACMGYSAAGAGDVNGDGYSDIIVGAYQYDNVQTDEGAAFIYHGSATGIVTTPAALLESNQAGAFMGISVAGAGDVNGDGYSDVIVGAEGYDNPEASEGAAFVYHGSAAGIKTTAAAMVESNHAVALMGHSVASAGDVNGDGYSDVIVGAPLNSNGQNAFVYHGSATGISTTAAVILQNNQAGQQLGISVASAGDINGDGYSDVIVGAPRFNTNFGTIVQGAAYIHYGSATGINAAPAAILLCNQGGAQMGRSVASAGDVNGDGYSDVIVGAYSYDNGETDEGVAFVYTGSPSGSNIVAATQLENNQPGAALGASVAGAGDVNGDGYGDVIVGAWLYDNGENDEGIFYIYHGSATGISTTPAASVEGNQAGAWMGSSVAGAGDVNGDGYSDVIVAAYSYDHGETDEGVAFVYHGSATGINTTPAALLECNQASAEFGSLVAGAGDVNGDGYSDVIVGAWNYNNGESGEGVTFVYHGSSSGINTTPAALMECNQANAKFGVSVAGAGDVNGDGYSDVIVGAYLYDNGLTNEGAAFIYHGSATGINTTAATMVESNQADAQLGISVAGAGDVNGDGYGDVIVGAWNYDNSLTNEGAAFIYHGSATGISTTAAAMVESNQFGASMGNSVAGAGDVNGDGYSDVIVGAYRYSNPQNGEGAFFIYHGSATGINTTAVAMGESEQTNAELGTFVAGAGDVNGDGYSDVIVGAYFYDHGETDEGAAFVYLGNSPGTGIRNNLNIYNNDLTTPINSSNFPASTFGAGLFAKSFLGGTVKGKLVWETQLSFNAFSGSPITNSIVYTSAQSGYTNLGITGRELKSIVAKQTGSRYTKIRARVKYDLVTALTGQIYGPWRYVSNIVSGFSLGALPVDLISFKAEWLEKGKTAQLKFITDNESDVCCYEVERSSDGVTFTTIGKVTAKNTGSQTNYSYTDLNATGKKIYYRLQTRFNSGTTNYSNIQMLELNSTTEIMVFPNPAKDIVQLRLNNTYATMKVQIINAGGQTVKQFNNVSTAGQLLAIPVSDLQTGAYFLYLQSGSEHQVLQFVKE